MTTGTDNLDNTDKCKQMKDLGLVEGHAYGLIAAHEITDKNGV